MQRRYLLPIFAVAALAGGCTTDAGPKQTGGAIVGAVAGGLIGAQIGDDGSTGELVATAAGVALGAWVGSEIGKSMDDQDRLEAERSAQRALESNPDGVSSTWNNPNTGHGGSTTPTRTYQASSGSNCREYTTSVVIDGRTETATGTACRQADGTWKIVN
ncbi:MAG: RT0821/Lpp0805 family surface protein [Dongiaceae bacterium]